MKILIVDELVYPLGGVQERVKALAEQWFNLGHNVTVATIDQTGKLSDKETINGVFYDRLIHDADYYKSGSFGRKISTIIKFSFKLKFYFKQEWDLIIFCQFPLLPQIFYKLFYKKRSKTVLDFVEYRDSKLWKILNRIIINGVDHVICISEHVKTCVLLYRKDNIDVIPSFVDTTSSISKSQKNYIFLGRMVEHKHPEHAIEAVIKYNTSYNKDMQLILVGGGGMLESLKNKYKDIKYIKLLGHVDTETKKEVLSNGRMLILPSEREGLPMSVIEAMSYGIPTVTTNYPGNGTQFFVNQENIGKIALGNADDIAKKINELEENYDYFNKRCEEIKCNYDLTLLSKKYLEIVYSQLSRNLNNA
jgi:glycosyltransferase involved in cell wall biosynthesis